mmetsp:Transcript_34643/g.104590  ORF Transcript_34643/g.104590 Transcript_34643/m.104590 type:complete len:370 (-) Transcript_34643:493-1602(-)
MRPAFQHEGVRRPHVAHVYAPPLGGRAPGAARADLGLVAEHGRAQAPRAARPRVPELHGQRAPRGLVAADLQRPVCEPHSGAPPVCVPEARASGRLFAGAAEGGHRPDRQRAGRRGVPAGGLHPPGRRDRAGALFRAPRRGVGLHRQRGANVGQGRRGGQVRRGELFRRAGDAHWEAPRGLGHGVDILRVLCSALQRSGEVGAGVPRLLHHPRAVDDLRLQLEGLAALGRRGHPDADQVLVRLPRGRIQVVVQPGRRCRRGGALGQGLRGGPAEAQDPTFGPQDLLGRDGHGPERRGEHRGVPRQHAPGDLPSQRRGVAHVAPERKERQRQQPAHQRWAATLAGVAIQRQRDVADDHVHAGLPFEQRGA